MDNDYGYQTYTTMNTHVAFGRTPLKATKRLLKHIKASGLERSIIRVITVSYVHETTVLDADYTYEAVAFIDKE